MHYICDYHGVIAGTPGIDLLREPFADGDIGFTNPKRVDWWEQQLREILIDYSFDGWMEDCGEWVADTDRFFSGKTGRQMTNLYALLDHEIRCEICQRAKPHEVGFVRSGYAGSQGYTRVAWGGDPSVVPAGVTAGLSGFAVWGPGINGNGYSKELWIRWLEFGALKPVIRDDPWDKPAAAINLWYDSETLDLFRRYAGLHISLFPYFYTYAGEAAKTGLPIIRHPMLEFSEDPQAYKAEEEYLRVKKLLVGPVDYWAGELFTGGGDIRMPAPLDQIPILMRAGSIIPIISAETQPLAADTVEGSSTLAGSLTWRVFPAPQPYRDAFALCDGAVATVYQDASMITVQVKNSPVAHDYEVIVPATESPREVHASGKTLQKIDSNDHRTRESGWWMDPKDNTVRGAVVRR
ncbi:MAG: hypothetical protein DMG69_26860 [Acidobacteria bacterium]|nr:MAG: hypothetical protein DMG69_26860 [Acidobacteriota bacterium]